MSEVVGEHIGVAAARPNKPSKPRDKPAKPARPGDKPSTGHRLRLLEGMTTAVARKGYPRVTIADVVAEAGVSKRTFYEHFESKEDCLLACYDDGSTAMMAAIRQQLSVNPGHAPARIADVLDSYLALLDRAPQMAATLLIEVQRSGAQGRRIYRRNNLELATLIRDAVAAGPWAAGFDLDQALALVAGVNELVLTHAEDHPEQPFGSLAPTLLKFVGAVIGVPLPQ